jgi:nitrate/nitrite transporter NarK
MPFVLERVYGDSPLTAGLRLTAIPVALGLVAPISGALSDRLGARLLTVTGMLTVLASLLMLAYAFDSNTGGLLLLTGYRRLAAIDRVAGTARRRAGIVHRTQQ